MEKIKDIFEKNKYWIISLFFVMAVGFGVGFSINQNPKEDTFDQNISVSAQEGEELEDSCDVRADISGSVVNQGVYCLQMDSIIDDLITASGGLSPEVCEEWVLRELNKAQTIENGQKLFIPSNKDSECLKDSGVIQTKDNGNSKININTCSKSDLEDLPGIGPAIAENIINGRPYKKLEDILDVKGIGTSIFEKIKDKVSL